jgi:hypothetical protein
MNHDDDEIEHIYLDDEDQHPSSPQGPRQTVEAVESKAEYKKFYRLLTGIFVVAVLLSLVRGWDIQRQVADFMAVFFITFAALKFYDIESFAHAYRDFDILAQKFRPWGYLFPFVEAFLGFWYLLSEAPIRLNVTTLVVTGIAAYGVRQSMKHKKRLSGPPLSTFIRLPLSKVSFIEDTAMLGLAFLMIILNAFFK